MCIKVITKVTTEVTTEVTAEVTTEVTIGVKYFKRGGGCVFEEIKGCN